MTVTPSELDIIRGALDAALAEVHTCMPAEVVRVHAGDNKRQFVDVQPSLQRRAPNEDGQVVDETLPVIPMVPVGYMQGGGFFISVPIAVGDFVLLVFAERSLDQWLQTARKGSQRAITPGDVGTHTLEGAVALPCGPAPRTALLAGVSATDLVIGHVTGGRIQITPAGEILAGAATGHDFVALAAKVDKIFEDLHSVFTGWTVAPQDGGAALKAKYATVFSAAPASVAATKVKAT
jgi:Phage protein Gp138 N-terminal domain